MNIKTIDTCTLGDIITIWNEGFSNYFVPVHVDLNSFIKRLANEDLRVGSSFVAEEDGALQGILLNGFRENDGEVVAWNGGTAVHPKARRKGVGRMLLEKSIEEYKEHNVKRASLEAIKGNTAAILLYENLGYKIKDELIFFKGNVEKKSTINVEFTRPELLPQLTIYNQDVPWQCHVKSNLSAQVAVFFDQLHNPIGYTLFQQTNGETKIIQFEVLDTVTKDEFCAMLAVITEGGNFTTVNTPLSSQAAKFFISLNTEEVIRQVWMEKEMDR
ncbi:GNAT family N-acetyltransferase [Ureibacillus sp. Re31]|uniref:GNAT family N-acetyltransferase n=1 Tax=Ureibacillus galli TaxID=2762222 RepID=A0ABR8XAI4_9BACL|nr:GNAT family N-acetyltransferase [Ureibacillus galli]MBD8026327.1 GNAT family N-acetyltransferase [Ureibacillus galli]